MIDSKLASKLHWATELSSDLTNKLLSIAQFKNKMKPSDLDDSSIAHQGISFILEGTVTICMQTPNLKTVNNIVMGQGDWFGSYDIESASYTPFFLNEIVPLSLIHFKNSDMQLLAKDNVEMYKWFHSHSFAAKAKWLQSQLMMSENILSRVVYLLLELAAHIPFLIGETPRFFVSQQQLSRITGIARQRVNESIKQLEREHLVHLDRGCIYLNDISGLGNKLANVDLSIRDPRKLIHR
ncbi:Crp/Fnr family transcriptional regulator [Shewanella canadensis]|uniref:Crp/Fnr family transcriptional regulator n=1 Tax=Shewanella canadensis TaxID=271096 RepID=A0A3S0LQI0_9GAMM|nr:Crp/Fnr family transcriptional regulator [Shewanella canadensis]RTR40965.1 Crp/Fnr family transcriptional regulator [Shewanella canadensis]RTR40977.1 Crp/Fnr family transcriptional regulator [Shewanella canadensis]